MECNVNLRRLWRLTGSLLLAIALLFTLMPQISSAAPTDRAAAAYGTQHTVRPGETLSQIAAYYGVTVGAIMQANGLSNPNYIYVGQVLAIPGQGGCVTYHTVQYGQTLTQVAAYYGISYYVLAQTNQISNPNQVWAGMTLCIPGGTGGPSYGAVTYYTVRPGDTLTRIANTFGVTVNAIMQVNGLSNPNFIYVGQSLQIPGVHQTPPPVVYPQPQPPPQPPPTPVPAPTTWTGIFYNNTNFSGSPVLTQEYAAIDFNWGLGSPAAHVSADNFSAIWTTTGYFSGGTYRFYALSDDGVRVYVDDRLLIDGWGVHPATGYYGDLYLSAGEHRVRVEYFEAQENALITVNWSRR